MSEYRSPFERHVFVCISGAYCPMLDGDSMKIYERFKQEVARAGLRGRVRVNKSGCLDQCGHGPNAVVYPDGVWYSHLTEEDVSVIVREHLLEGHPVERLRYSAPQPGANKLKRDTDGRLLSGQVDGCRLDRPIVPEREED